MRRVIVAGWSLLVTLAMLLSAWSTIVASHPAYLLASVLIVLVAGTVIGVWGRRVRDQLASGRAGRAGRAHRASRSPAATVRTLLAGTLCVAVAAFVWYFRPISASPSALALLGDSAEVDVTETLTRIDFEPVGGATTGLVFSPGALVDARAYAPTLRPLAEAGFLVVVIKLPLGIAFFGGSAVTDVIAEHPEIDHWAVGGHSLGGAAASSYARDHAASSGSDAVGRVDSVDGLVLWGAYPTGSLADRTELDVLSVSAANDGLATPAEIAASTADLPPSSTFVEIDGAVHAFFGDYGDQRGDGSPSVSRRIAQDEIVSVTVGFLASLSR